MIELAKNAIDVGLYTNQLDAMLSFWQNHVPFSELLRVGGGVHQHRHAIGDSILKINHVREPLGVEPPSGLRRLSLAADVDAPLDLEDPDGNRLRLVPDGSHSSDGITQLRVDMTVNDLQAHRRFYGDVLGFPEVAEATFACGVSQLKLEQGNATIDPVQRAPGFRYLTIQVFDVKGCHQQVLDNGGREGMAPVRLGDVAHISFIRDPDGNWIEISQRKSITGSLD